MTINEPTYDQAESAFRRHRGDEDSFQAEPLINRNVPPLSAHPSFVSDDAGVKPRPMTTLFEINGVEYQIENRKRPNLSYGYLRRIREEGQVAATAWLMEKLLTKEALLALENYEDMTEEEDNTLQKALDKIALGGGGSGPKG